MLSYALRPETWATTRLELEGRGVSWSVLTSLGSPCLRALGREKGRPASASVPAAEMTPSLLRALVPALPQAQAMREVAPVAGQRERRMHPLRACPGPAGFSLLCAVALGTARVPAGGVHELLRHRA